MIRSGWLDGSEDAEIAEIKGIMSELGATARVNMLGEGANYTDDPEAHKMYKGDKGLYWTTEELSSVTFTGGTGEKKILVPKSCFHIIIMNRKINIT